MTSTTIRAKAVAVDLDGTMMDTAGEIAAAANRMLEELGRPALPMETVRGYIGNGVPRLVHRCLTGEREADAEPELFERALPLFRSHYTEILGSMTTVYPGVAEGLAAMKARGVKLVCITNKAADFTLPLLECTRLGQYFDLVICGDTLPEKKPHPMALVHAAEQFGVMPPDLAMLGDSATDVKFARNAGCPVFLVPYGYESDVGSLPADGFVASIADFAARLES